MSTFRPMRTSASITTALILTVSLAACGAGGGDDPAATPMQSETTTTQAPTPTQTPEETMSGMDGDASAVMPMGTGDPFADARTAAQHMPMTAETLAGGFVAALDIPGDPGSDAADLRAGLTSLLSEHVYLAGIAVATAYVAGADSAEFEGATATLDANTVALGDAVGSLAGDDNRETFLALWREHIGYFVDYAVATKAGDTAGQEEAMTNLEGYAQDAGAFFEEVSAGQLPAADIASSLHMHVDTLSAAIDGLAAGSPEAYASLRAAAAHVVESAGTLSTGLAAATGTEGDAHDEATELRTQLTANLTEHVYLAAIAVFTAYTTEGGTDSEAFQAAAGELDANSVALSEAVGSLAGEEQAEAFLELWREHIGYFVDYANAVATGDAEAAEAALVELDAYRGEAGTFFEEISAGELPADAVAEELAMHVQTLAGAIDSLNAALVQGR